MMYEFRSRIVQAERDWGSDDAIEKACNEWAKEGWEVFSVVVPQPSNWTTYRLTARRRVITEDDFGGKTK
jgi:hypothetical protein